MYIDVVCYVIKISYTTIIKQEKEFNYFSPNENSSQCIKFHDKKPNKMKLVLSYRIKYTYNILFYINTYHITIIIVLLSNSHRLGVANIIRSTQSTSGGVARYT